jgi:hypothetical protein
VFVFIFISEEFDGVGDKGSGDTTIIDVQPLLKVFLNGSLSYVCFH